MLSNISGKRSNDCACSISIHLLQRVKDSHYLGLQSFCGDKGNSAYRFGLMNAKWLDNSGDYLFANIWLNQIWTCREPKTCSKGCDSYNFFSIKGILDQKLNILVDDPFF